MIMGFFRKSMILLFIILVIIQFFQPALNKSDQVQSSDISNILVVPGQVLVLLKGACYDCHSNNTVYPWYAHIQPIAWFLSRHIRRGKQELNFNEFGKDSRRKQISKLNGILNSLKDGNMPPSSYKWMHRSARLSDTEKYLLMNWISRTKDSLSAN